VRFRVSSRIENEVRSPLVLLLNIRAHASEPQRIIKESFTISPKFESELVVTEPDKNRFDRVKVTKGSRVRIDYRAEVEVDHRHLGAESLRKVSPAHLDQAQLPYLLPSRYCQSDLFGRFAWQKFGAIKDAYDQVLAITEWIRENVEYIPGTTNSFTSASDTVTQCAGVCRDFAHLGIAICRALNIPARYFTGYAYTLDPPDFHACFEAFIGGYWILFDATRLVPANALVRIGSGRDAADVSLCTAFGILRTLRQEVKCQVHDEKLFHPLSEEELSGTAVSLDVKQI
jgi:transglutaminase-like putative cysteine protease